MDSIGLNLTMSAEEKLHVQNAVTAQNAKNAAENGRTAKQELGKDDFITLLITQMQNQDPTKPMENTEFIAQMAQFSSLEQMMNMSNGFTKVASVMSSNEALSTVGKSVELDVNGSIISGTVNSATRGENPQVEVNGMFYNMEQIKKVYAY